MGSELDRRGVLQGVAAAGVAGVMGAGPTVARQVAPAVFVSHGSPMTALDSDAYPQALKRLGDSVGAVKALVVVSAHWETEARVHVTAMAAPPLVYDFYGFPEEMYRLRYPAPGAPELSLDVVARLQAAGVPAVAEASRGLDHGVWVPLRHAFPEARVPVIQVALPAGASPADVARMGEALRPLRADGVLLMGSGGVVHNLRRVNFRSKLASVEPWAAEFDAWVAGKLVARDFIGLQSWMGAPNARVAHPSAEHWLPIYFVLGAALAEDRLTPVFEGFHHGTLSMRSFALRA
ncbi:class III extradiol ring-cleavage dioxygenase [Corallococcus sp. BB11-1]|uniref:DODA-type extradiol aromatic ring-opening family dioxygenase n=1 Tax=Corallococcus sp. BB11-1 TaxID=2996783 RepID=UPI002271DA9A|nr:class III extradiol ring-cleavage dioxygenase [Corallococcus sp. BB11-1]MCY1034987.1 class III extradiol ring-cleavage dioxygenase [Corallococcus sp. BB11-1]